ncbi:N-acetyltransferase 14-like isoform X2 [Acipenser oxyrinchus oxyrinchus]|uniref:Probable N-acetyltransferase 14 n=1 Tax=Acipenser oxyrinchus oxyrinchus TaxID=40147 RepID=A0AAD8FQT4_ACIOX|nr:N-acetyltransferase 14-like isoform X2 [Acipenser oxyrinchus oxyrinchus]
MPTLDLSTMLVREMREDEAEFVTELLKDCFRGSENRLVLYLLTRPCSLLLLAVGSSALRFVFNSFMAALVVPVLLALCFLKLSCRGVGGLRDASYYRQDAAGSSDTRETRKDSDTSKASKVNEHSKTNTASAPSDTSKTKPGAEKGDNTPGCSKPGSEDSDSEWSEGERGGVGRLGWGASFRVQLQLQPPPLAPALWVCESQGEVLGCVARDAGPLPGQALLCCLAVSSWHRRQGLGSAMVTRFERQARRDGFSSIGARVSAGSKVGVAFFQKLGYESCGAGERGWLGYSVTQEFRKQL